MAKGKDKKGGKGKKGAVEEEEAEEEEEKEYDTDLWTWESYSVSFDVLEPIPKEEKSEKEKKEKPKKGKKGEDGEGAKKEAKVEEPPVETGEPDVFAEMMRMKAEAEAKLAAELMTDEPVSESTAKSKKSKKAEPTGPPEPLNEESITAKGKKMSKKERTVWLAEMAKQTAIQAELDALKAAEDERLRLIEERKANIEKDKREVIEQRLRVEQLTNTMNLMNSVNEQNRKRAMEDKEKTEWEQFLKCDGLPDPYYCGQMNTYLHRWDKCMEKTTMEDAIQKTNEVFQLLDILTLLVDDPSGATERTVGNWKWILTLFKKYQQMSLDTATYMLLRDVQRNLRRLNIPTADYRKKEERFIFCLYVMVQLPHSMPNPRKPVPPQLILDFFEMSLHVVFPTKIDCICMGIRALYLKYDHLSDLCATFAAPPIPEEYQTDLCTNTKEDFRKRLYYKYEEYRKEQRKNPEVDKKDRLKKIDPASDDIPKVPYIKLEVTASQYALGEDEKLCMGIRDRMRIYVEDDVINLRKCVILGGTFYLDLYYQPPQPKDMVTFVMTVTRLERPPFLEEAPFYETYNPPLPTEPSVILEPEEIEEEMRKVEEALGKLLFVTLTLPKHILWLDIPFICQWNKEQKVWNTTDVHDFKYIEEKGYVTFRTGKFGCFGIGSYKFTNLPFQAWEIKPELNGSVTVQITAAILLIEFNIKDNLVCLTELQNGPTEALQELIGHYYRLPKLVRLMTDGGVDIFPNFDSFCYIEGTCEKHWQMERHLYHCMAQLSVCYNFMWSRWNNAAGRRIVVMQMREYKPEKTRQVPFSTLMITPFRAALIECTEISPEFTAEVCEGMMFYADLIHLMKAICSMPIRAKVFNAPGHLVATISKLLLATRVLSFSS